MTLPAASGNPSIKIWPNYTPTAVHCMRDNTRAAHTAASPTPVMPPNDDGLSNWQFGVAKATYEPLCISSHSPAIGNLECFPPPPIKGFVDN